jgi:hypothetical protein
MERSFHAQAALLLAERIGWHLRLAELPGVIERPCGTQALDLFGGLAITRPLLKDDRDTASASHAHAGAQLAAAPSALPSVLLGGASR